MARKRIWLLAAVAVAVAVSGDAVEGIEKRLVTMRRKATALSDQWTSASAAEDCPCKHPDLCKPIPGPPLQPKEVYGFNGGNFSNFNWTHITTVAWVADDELTCLAHENGARSILASPSVVLTSNLTARQEWIASALQQVQAKYMDGIVFDWESPTPVGSDIGKWYAALIDETRIAFHAANPSYQVTTCVAWSPDNIDGRGYPMNELADSSDALYVMDYDTQSQNYDHACLASANAPYPGMIRGMSRYFDLGIPASKLILGVPWYGYKYECLPGTPKDSVFCPVPLVPFRGVNCSDAAGREIAFSDIMDTFRTNASRVTAHGTDNNMIAPFFTYTDEGTVIQYWYDNAQSLSIKYAWANEHNVRGVGPFQYGDLDPINQPDLSRDIWAAFDVFVNN